MTTNEKLDAVYARDLLCACCKIRSACTGGTFLGPSGPVFPSCVDGDYSNLFDEDAFDRLQTDEAE